MRVARASRRRLLFPRTASMLNRDTMPVRGLSTRWNLARRRPAPPAHPELRRALGLTSATLLVVGGIIGSGIFFTPAEVARALPSWEWILLAWMIGGIVAFAGALTYAELGAMMPEAGGAYVYIREAFGRLPAFLYGWMTLASIASGALAAVAMGFAGYVANAGIPIDAIGGRLGLALLTIALMAAVNYFGVKPGAWVQNILTVAKVGALAFLIIGVLVLWTRIAPPDMVANAPPPRPSILLGLLAAFPPVLFTIGGWQQMNMVAGEIREPERLILRALAIGIGIVVVCYLGANVAYLHALGRDGLAASSAIAAATAERLAGRSGSTIITAGVALSILGFVNVTILANSRIFYAMAKDGAFLEAASKVHPRWGSPHVAILALATWSAALLLITKGDLGQLLAAVVFADWIFFGLGAASVFVLRRTQPLLDRPYRVWGYPAVPAFFVIAACAGVLSAIYAAPLISLLGVGLLALGVLVFLAYARRGRAMVRRWREKVKR